MAATERLPDKNVGFVFNLKGVIETPLSVALQIGYIGAKIPEWLRTKNEKQIYTDTTRIRPSISKLLGGFKRWIGQQIEKRTPNEKKLTIKC